MFLLVVASLHVLLDKLLMYLYSKCLSWFSSSSPKKGVWKQHCPAFNVSYMWRALQVGPDKKISEFWLETFPFPCIFPLVKEKEFETTQKTALLPSPTPIIWLVLINSVTWNFSQVLRQRNIFPSLFLNWEEQGLKLGLIKPWSFQHLCYMQKTGGCGWMQLLYLQEYILYLASTQPAHKFIWC